MGIALFFGSTTGNTEDIADQIRNILGSDRVDIFNVADDSVSLMLEYSTVICGIPTWDYGELQADWEDIWEEIDALDLTGIQMAFFGCGDQIGYPECPFLISFLGFIRLTFGAFGVCYIMRVAVCDFELC